MLPSSEVAADGCVLEGVGPPARPYTLIVRTTERCEVGCAHCSIKATPRGRDLATDVLAHALDGARLAGVGLVHFSGGEPLLAARLDEQIRMASELGFYVEVTTSTFTRPGDDPHARLAGMKASGLQRLMLSYDAAHARRVPIGHYAAYVREAQRLDIEVCACVVEWPGAPWSLERVIDECAEAECDVGRVDWCRVELSPVGRASTFDRRTTTKPSCHGSARCPYVLTAPTLVPDGTVVLCPNVVSDAPLFRLGNVGDRSLDAILADFVGSRFYRALAAEGPEALLRTVAPDAASKCTDMCGACQSLLRLAEGPELRAAIEALAPPDDEPVRVDLEALLPGHRRFVLGEERPEMGCRCG